MHKSHLDIHNINSSMPRSFGYEKSIPSRYEKSINGDVSYVVSVDVGEFNPNDVKVQQRGQQLIIEAKKNRVNGQCNPMQSREESEYKELRKEITLPINIDMNKPFTSQVNAAGILEVFMPTLPDSYATLYPPHSRPISVQRSPLPQTVTFPRNPAYSVSSSKHTFPAPSSDYQNMIITPTYRTTTNNAAQLQNRNSTLPTKVVVNGNRHPHLFTEEISLDPVYRAEDVSVRTRSTPNGNKVVITARHHDLGNNGFSNTKEFNDEHCLPINIDLNLLKATFTERSTILIEAPYKKHEVPMRTPIIVRRD